MIIAAAVIAIILIGECLAYVANPYHANITFKENGDRITYTIDATYESTYDAVVIENCNEVETVYLYKDPNYGTKFVSKAYADNDMKVLKDELAIRGVNAKYADANELVAICDDTNPEKTGIVVMYGAFPDTIYYGNAACPLISYLEKGGHLYWINGILGKYISDSSGNIDTCFADANELFFNQVGCIGTRGGDIKTDSKDRNLGLALNYFLWDINYGLKSDMDNCISIGYDSENGYGSTVIAKVGGGDGSVCVFSAYSGGRSVLKNVSQAIASHIDYDSVLQYHENGRGRHVENTIDLSKYAGDNSIYVYLGQEYASCGKYYSE